MPQIDEWDDRPTGLALRLRELRAGAGLTGTRMADALGWTQSKVSRIENLRQIPTADDLHAWVTAAGADDGTERELSALVTDVRAQYLSWREEVRARGLAGVQVSYDDLARDSSVVRTVEVAVVPGLLQTADYARHRLQESAGWFGMSDQQVEAGVAARIRRQTVLYDPSKRFEFVMTEAVLRTLVCPPEVMLGQLDRLLGLLGLPNVRIGILPLMERLPAVPLHGFGMWDDTVTVETYDSEKRLSVAEGAVYLKIMNALVAAAKVGADARVLIGRAARELT